MISNLAYRYAQAYYCKTSRESKFNLPGNGRSDRLRHEGERLSLQFELRQLRQFAVQVEMQEQFALVECPHRLELG